MAHSPHDETNGPAIAGVRIRTASWDDLDDVAALFAVAGSGTGGARPARTDDLRIQWLGYPDLSETVVVETLGGPDGGPDGAPDRADAIPSVVAYAAFEIDEDPWSDELSLHLEFTVHPDHRARGIGGFLLARALERVREEALARGRDRATLRTSLVDGDERSLEWFTSRGFVAVRHLLDFRLDLHAPPPAPVWHAGISARPFVPGRDERRLWRTHQAAFADVPTHLPLDLDDFLEDRLLRGPGNPDAGLVLIAEHDAVPVGVAICRAGTPVAPQDGWVRDLGVLPGWRRHGIGMALLRTAFAAFRVRGLTGVALEVDDVTLDGAAALYRRAGMRTTHRTDVLERVVDVGRPSTGTGSA